MQKKNQKQKKNAFHFCELSVKLKYTNYNNFNGKSLFFCDLNGTLSVKCDHT